MLKIGVMDATFFNVVLKIASMIIVKLLICAFWRRGRGILYLQ